MMQKQDGAVLEGAERKCGRAGGVKLKWWKEGAMGSREGEGRMDKR